MFRRTRMLAVGLAAALALSSCAGAPTSSAPAVSPAASFAPVTLTNCGEQVTIDTPPTAAVTLNQGATEVMLALGLQDRMAGTAYLDDQIPERWKAGYDQVKVLAEKYPAKEAFLAAEPDFAYASYSSAFTDQGVGSRSELGGEKIATYLSPFGCPKGVEKAPSTMNAAWGEVSEVAKIFGAPERADALISQQKDALAGLRTKAAGKGKSALWYDSGDKELFAGAGGGGPQIVLETVGATNIFADVEGNWATVSWEKAIQADPDVIVLADASWSTAKAKIAHLEGDPVLRKLKAVKAKAYVTIPFSESTPGVRLVDGATTVSDQIATL